MLRTILVSLVLACSAAHAAKVEEVFGQGVLGLAWGATLQEAQAKLPNGFTWETSRSQGHYFAYELSTNSDLFGPELPAIKIHLYFDKKERLHAASFFYSYAQSNELLYRAGELLGQDFKSSDHPL